MKQGLTIIQKQVLVFLSEFQQRAGSMPTRAEISANFNWKSANAAETHLRSMERFGYLELSTGTSRGLRFTQKARDAIGAPSSLPGGTMPMGAMLALPVINMALVRKTWTAERAGGAHG